MIKQAAEIAVAYSQILNDEKKIRQQWRSVLETMRRMQSNFRSEVSTLKNQFKVKIHELEHDALEKAYHGLTHLLDKHREAKSQALQEASKQFDKKNQPFRTFSPPAKTTLVKKQKK